VAIDACQSVTFDPVWYDHKMGLDSFYRPGGELSQGQKLLYTNETDRCRIVFTSDGAEDNVPERSNFAKNFLLGLREGLRQDGILTSEGLAAYLRFSSPKPRLTRFGDDENGSFLFISTSNTPFPLVPAEDDENAWQNVRLIDSEVSYNSYLLLFRQGRHRAEAQAAIDSIHLSQLTKRFILDPFSEKMILVEGGVYEMGCDRMGGQSCSEVELPAHQVKVNSFYLGKYEVTQREWADIMSEKPADSIAYCPDCPVVRVSWDMIQEFLARVNSRTTTAYYRLPTEAEWEYAARGGAKTMNNPFAGGEDLDLVAWHDGNSGGSFHPVGQKLANELEFYDMSGNVCEWCQDKWHANYKGAPVDGKSWVQEGTVGRVFRGGCWNRLYLDCHTSARYWDYPHSRFDNVGFRLARSK